MTDTNHHVLTGKVDITSNLLVGSSHLFVDTNNNRVGLVTANPDAGLHVNSNAYVNTDLRVGSQIEINATAGRVKAASFEGDGSLLENIPAGADGAAATIGTPTITTGLAGTEASVTNSGTSSAAVFDFVIPRGDPGTNGTNGNDGTNGANGEDGAAATIGNPTITTGLAGTEASVTNSGTSSAAVFDFVIPRGDAGTPGTNGTNGTNYFTLSGSNIYRTTGNVGIGTDSPETIFQIGSKAAATGVNYLKIRGNNTSTFSDICGIIFNNSSSASLDGLRGESKIINERAVNNYGSALAFYTNPADNPGGANPPGVNSVKRMVIGDDGNVGIPTTSEFKLDVGGSYTSGRSLAVRSGDTSSATDSIQILLGYANGLDYAHSIRTRHNSAGYDNAIDFWCWDTSTTASTYGNKRVMSVEAKEIAGSREGLVTVHGVMIATSQPRWCWYGSGNGNWTSVGYLTYSTNLVTQTRIGGSSGGGYAVAQVAGVYCVSWCAFTESNVPVNTGVVYEIRRNNGGFMRNYHNQPKTNYSATGGLQCLIPLNVGDHVRVYTSSAVHANANSCFSGFLVA